MLLLCRAIVQTDVLHMHTCVTTVRKKLNSRSAKVLKIERGMDTKLNYASCKCV